MSWLLNTVSRLLGNSLKEQEEAIEHEKELIKEEEAAEDELEKIHSKHTHGGKTGETVEKRVTKSKKDDSLKVPETRTTRSRSSSPVKSTRSRSVSRQASPVKTTRSRTTSRATSRTTSPRKARRSVSRSISPGRKTRPSRSVSRASRSVSTSPKKATPRRAPKTPDDRARSDSRSRLPKASDKVKSGFIEDDVIQTRGRRSSGRARTPTNRLIDHTSASGTKKGRNKLAK